LANETYLRLNALAFRMIYFLLDLTQNSSVEWEIARYIAPTQDGHALYKLVLEAADTSKGELQAKVFDNYWKMKITQSVPSPLQLKNFGYALWANWLELEGSAATALGAKQVMKHLMRLMPRGNKELWRPSSGTSTSVLWRRSSSRRSLASSSSFASSSTDVHDDASPR
jgi:hypothetical protein